MKVKENTVTGWTLQQIIGLRQKLLMLRSTQINHLSEKNLLTAWPRDTGYCNSLLQHCVMLDGLLERKQVEIEMWKVSTVMRVCWLFLLKYTPAHNYQMQSGFNSYKTSWTREKNSGSNNWLRFVFYHPGWWLTALVYIFGGKSFKSATNLSV